MITDGLFADRKTFTNLRVTEALGDECEDLALSFRKLGEGWIFAAVRPDPDAGELEYFVAETFPCRLVLEKDMIS